METDAKPTPGSPEAVLIGCTCPVMDNASGRGCWGTRGKDAIFVMSADCKVHGQPEAEDEATSGLAV